VKDDWLHLWKSYELNFISVLHRDSVTPLQTLKMYECIMILRLTKTSWKGVLTCGHYVCIEK